MIWALRCCSALADAGSFTFADANAWANCWMPSDSFAQSELISLGGWMARTLSAACWRACATAAGSFSVPLSAGETELRAAAAWVQNFEPEAFALVAGALELAALEEDALSSLPEPPQAVSRATAATTESPCRHTVRVRRMDPRLVAGRASAKVHGYGAEGDRAR